MNAKLLRVLRRNAFAVTVVGVIAAFLLTWGGLLAFAWRLL